MPMLDERQSEKMRNANGNSLDELLSAIVGQADSNLVAAARESTGSQPATGESSEELPAFTNDLLLARVMIVDDEPINVKVARKFVETLGYSNFVTLTDSRQVIESLRKETPDVILLDLMMPDVSGLDILEVMQSDEKLKRIPVIILTASSDRESRLKALQLGATDFLAKPLDPEELAPRIRNALLMRSYENHFLGQAETLEEIVRDRTRELCASRLGLVHCLARAAEHRDDDTGKHILRVGRYAALIAREADLPGPFIEMLELAAQLHDVGKIGIADAILLKPGRLTDDERSSMELHAQVGADVLNAHDDILGNAMIRHAELGELIPQSSRSPLTKLAASIALTHHEKWDGSGYPNGLSETDISIEGRITAIADVFDALRSARPYKEAFSFDRSFDILLEGRGQHFDPELLDYFVACRPEIEALDEELRKD
jgi:putative two-component system response regulator